VLHSTDGFMLNRQGEHPLAWITKQVAVVCHRGLLSPLNGRTARFRISMYVDDVVILLRPTTNDVNNLRDILVNFGLVTGLQTNLQKQQSLLSAAVTSTWMQFSRACLWPAHTSQ
jgi:hypothetical protein